MASPAVGQVAAWTGTGWTQTVTLDAGQHIQGLSCQAPTFCSAIDGSGNSYVYNAPTWSPSGSASGAPSAASCASTTFCVALEDGNVASWNGSAWSKAVPVDSNDVLLSVSCPSAQFCVAGDSEGSVITWTGTAWTKPQVIDVGSGAATPDNLLVGVSCTGASFCVAVDSGGRAFLYNGQTWGPGSQVVKGAELTAVSCATPSFCLATDTTGGVFAYR